MVRSTPSLDDSESIMLVLRAILRMPEHKFYYCRWIHSDSDRVSKYGQVMLELAFLTEPSHQTLPPLTALHHENRHFNHYTDYPGRWTVVHLHIPLDRRTFAAPSPDDYSVDWLVGVTGVTMFHTKSIHQPLPFPFHLSCSNDCPDDCHAKCPANCHAHRSAGCRAGYHADWQATHKGMPRLKALDCYWDERFRWFPGSDRKVEERQDVHRPRGFYKLLNEFGRWLCRQGVLHRQSLGYIWPNLGEYHLPTSDWKGGIPSGYKTYNPKPNAFNVNWLRDGSEAPDLRDARFRYSHMA